MTQEMINTCAPTSSRREVDTFFNGSLNADERRFTTEVVADVAKDKVKYGEAVDTIDFDEVHDQVVDGLKVNFGKWSEGGQRAHYDESRSPRYAGLCDFVRKQISSQILFAEKPTRPEPKELKKVTPVKTRNQAKEIAKQPAEEPKKRDAQKPANEEKVSGRGRPKKGKEE